MLTTLTKLYNNRTLGDAKLRSRLLDGPFGALVVREDNSPQETVFASRQLLQNVLHKPHEGPCGARRDHVQGNTSPSV